MFHLKVMPKLSKSTSTIIVIGTEMYSCKYGDVNVVNVVQINVVTNNNSLWCTVHTTATLYMQCILFIRITLMRRAFCEKEKCNWKFDVRWESENCGRHPNIRFLLNPWSSESNHERRYN